MAAATLTNPTVTPTGLTSATLVVTSNQASGTCYVVVTASVTKPSAAQIEAGQDNAGDPALYASSQVAATTNTFTATDIVRGGPRQLFVHFGQKNAGTEQSTVVTAASFFLDAFTGGVLTVNGQSAVCAMAYPWVGVTGTWGSGTATIYYQNAMAAWLAYPSGALTADGGMQLAFHRPTAVKVVLTGATSPSLTWAIC
jgi:hypothetical protein